MRYVAAYLLATLGGKSDPTVDDLKKILGSVGIEADTAKAEKVVKELTGKKVSQVIQEGSQKLASVPSGGGSSGGASSAAPAAAKAGSPAKKEEKKKVEEEEEEDDDMGFGLFD
jgi:large subunit ribosomal protein LP2